MQVGRTEAGIFIARLPDQGSKPKRISQHAAYYSHPVWSPDGARIVALRGSAHERQIRESDFGPVTGSDVVWFDAEGGARHTWSCRLAAYHGHILDLRPIASTCSLGLVTRKIRWYRFDLMARTAGRS